MKTKAVRLYGKQDLRLDDVILPEITDDEVQVEVISDSLCMSTYKASIEGSEHKRVPEDIAEKPVVVGHEFCGKVIKVGKNWEHKFQVGDGVAVQPAHFYQGTQRALGYSYTHCGGNAQYVNIPKETLLMDCLLSYNSDVYFRGSLAEPMSCIVGTFHAMYHTKAGKYVHDMGIVEGGSMALLAGIGPMGLGAIDYALHCDRRPSVLVVTSTNDDKLARAASIYTVEHAREMGVELHYVNTKKATDPVKTLKDITGGKGYDDVICFAPARQIIELGDAILGFDGCLNIFAGPADSQLKAELNMFNVHYSYTHLVGTSGGNTEDMREAIEMMDSGKINPTAMITHVGGLDCVVDTTLNLPNIAGGKKLIYNHISMPLTAISDFEELGKTDPMFTELAKICDKHNGLWNGEAEKYLLAHAKPIE